MSHMSGPTEEKKKHSFFAFNSLVPAADSGSSARAYAATSVIWALPYLITTSWFRA